MSTSDFNVDIAACRGSFIAREEKKLAERENRRQTALEAAAHLSITKRTVTVHLASIYSKLGVDSPAAIAVAAQRGLLPTSK
jgi:DNA-binding NarL/FixJ family response regulator